MTSRSIAFFAVALVSMTACSSASDAVGPIEDVGAEAEADGDIGLDVAAETDAARPDSTDASSEVAVDADGGCFLDTVGTFGECLTVSACAALGDHVSTAGYCPGPSSIECCTPAPNVADNPPTPAGWKLMKQADVTSDMTTWAVSILHDPTTYPMFSTTTRTFGTLDVLARVEWHPPDFLNSAIHRGVTLYSK